MHTHIVNKAQIHTFWQKVTRHYFEKSIWPESRSWGWLQSLESKIQEILWSFWLYSDRFCAEIQRQKSHVLIWYCGVIWFEKHATKTLVASLLNRKIFLLKWRTLWRQNALQIHRSTNRSHPYSVENAIHCMTKWSLYWPWLNFRKKTLIFPDGSISW